jgi:hypothetical protein
VLVELHLEAQLLMDQIRQHWDKQQLEEEEAGLLGKPQVPQVDQVVGLLEMLVALVRMEMAPLVKVIEAAELRVLLGLRHLAEAVLAQLAEMVDQIVEALTGRPVVPAELVYCIQSLELGFTMPVVVADWLLVNPVALEERVEAVPVVIAVLAQPEEQIPVVVEVGLEALEAQE